MPTRSIKTAVLAGATLAVASLVVTACGEKSSDQSGAGGAGGALFGAGGGGVPGGTAGASGLGTGGGGFMPPSTDAGACKKLDEPCERTTDCCDGNLCNRNGPVATLNGCKKPCTQNSECPTGCCYLFIGGTRGGMCSPAEWCTCAATGAACSPTLPPCCDTHQCQGGMCNQKCTQNSDCATHCCVPVPLLPGTSTCLDPMYCPAP